MEKRACRLNREFGEYFIRTKQTLFELNEMNSQVWSIE